jgi:acyl-CoA thioesterase-1
MHQPFLLRRHFNWLVLSLFSAGFCGVINSNLALANSATNQPSSKAQTVLIVGDSLSAEYGLSRGTGWVSLMSQTAAQEVPGLKIVNASISGDTTSGGVTRLPALLKLHQPQVLVIELGGNDALRGLQMSMTQQNLFHMANEGKRAGAKVLIIGMQVPPNYGASYLKQMDAAYLRVSKETGAQLNVQFLKGVADDVDPLKWFQSDRIHPNEGAQSTMMKNVWPQLKKMLRS